jgi:hypothetical protein
MSVQWGADVDTTHEYAIRVENNDPSQSGQYCAWDPGQLAPGDTTGCGANLGTPGTWTLFAWDKSDAATLAQVAITVVCPPGYEETPTDCIYHAPMEAESAEASPLVFYPLVRDGYRDTTRFSFGFSAPGSVRIDVRNSSGRVIRRVPLGTLQAGSWRWNGRNNGGHKVSTGYYRMRAVSADGYSTAHTRNIRTKVTTGWVTRSGSKRRWGNQVSSQSTSGNCFIQRSSYFGTASLDCWGGSYAKVTYGFSVPTTTFKYSGSVSGSFASDDICCDGSVTKGAYRASSRRIVAWAQVTGWRAYDVERVRVTYYYKKRI